MRKFLTVTLVLATALMALPGVVLAEVVNVAYWRGGESDVSPGPTGIFGVTDATTIDATGNGNDLTGLNNGQPGPYYVYPGADAQSTAAYGFNPPAGNLFYRSSPVTTAASNWGIQAWITGVPGADTRILLSIGNGGPGRGYSILQYNGTFNGMLNGVTLIDSGIAPDGAWHNLALVNDGGTTTVYVDSVAKGSTTAAVELPLSTDYTFLGGQFGDNAVGNPVNFAGGNMDEARVFTFAPGAFRVADLNNYVVPEPGTLALLATGLTGLLAYAWRKRK
jgi:hypothetical protein